MSEEQKTIPCLRCHDNNPNCPSCHGAGFIVPSPYVTEVLRIAAEAFGGCDDDEENPQ